MSNGYTGSDSASEAELIHIQDSLALNRALRPRNVNESGVCLDCGEDIPAARLEAVPNAACCVHCQAERDKKGPRLILRNVYVP